MILFNLTGCQHFLCHWYKNHFLFVLLFNLKNVFISDLRPEQKERILEYVEKLCMTLLHQVLFCPLFTNDEEMDLAIQKRYLRKFEALSSL